MLVDSKFIHPRLCVFDRKSLVHYWLGYDLSEKQGAFWCSKKCLIQTEQIPLYASLTEQKQRHLRRLYQLLHADYALLIYCLFRGLFFTNFQLRDYCARSRRCVKQSTNLGPLCSLYSMEFFLNGSEIQ